MCHVGPSRFAGNLDNLNLINGQRVRAIQKNVASTDLGNCDIIYLGQIEMAEMRSVAEKVKGLAVLTIAENDPECRSRAIFCLLFGDATMSFRLNVDSIARSRVRVDPRVLRLAKEG